MPQCSSCRLRYLHTPMGAVKLINVIFGTISLILVAVSFAPVWTLAVFTGIVATCLGLSLMSMTWYLLANPSFLHSKANRVTSFIFHILAGVALVAAGIELIGWSEYEPDCKEDCPRLYTVGIAKTLTFMNGTLYLIAAFLGLKDDDMLDPESAEDVPLMNSTTSIPTSLPGGNPKQYYNYYDRRHSRVSFDDIHRQHFYQPYRTRKGSHSSLENSYDSSIYGGTGGSHSGMNSNGGKRPRHLTTAFSMPTSGFTDLNFIKE